MFVNSQALVLFFTLLFSIYSCDEDVGDTCVLPNGANGICKLIHKCNGAVEALRKKVLPKACGFLGLDPIICCKSAPYDLAQVGGRAQKFCYDNYYQEPYFEKPEGNVIATVGGFDPLVAEFPHTADYQEAFSEKTEENILPSPPVVAGFDSLVAEFPHMAVLGFENNGNITWGCGGSLISEQYVLTAAHCLNSRELGPVKHVRLGDLNLRLNNDLAGPQNFTIKRTIAHKDYQPSSKYHDIALIELDRAVKTTTFVAPACLQVGKTITDKKLTATGWGRLGYIGDFADHLQKVYLTEIDNEECRSRYNKSEKQMSKGIVEDWQICAGSDTADTCQGDSGGPLQIKKYNRAYVVVGVTSFGKACGITKGSGVYTRVSNYIDWIETTVWPN